MAEQADLIFAFTPEEASDLGDLLDVAPERVQVVPSGVDTELFSPRDRTEARRRLEWPAHEHVVLFVGRPEPFKAPDLLVRALAKIRDEGLMRLVIVGGSEDEHSVDWLKGIARESGVESLITWHSAVPQSDLPDFYAAADLCAVPSYHESFGLAALESMACGTPVIASAVGSLKSLVSHGETGLLVSSHDPAVFAESIAELLADPELRERMGRRAHEYAAQFTWARSAERTLDGYLRATKGRQASQAVPCFA
jgi:D-inositol-3-phosphate glycosyltransferase